MSHPKNTFINKKKWVLKVKNPLFDKKKGGNYIRLVAHIKIWSLIKVEKITGKTQLMIEPICCNKMSYHAIQATGLLMLKSMLKVS